MTRGNPHLQVTSHAVVRARQRYGLANVDWLVVHDDVYLAFMQGRVSKEHPAGDGYRCRGRGVYAWTENLLRVYVVEPFANAQGRVCLRVITALPGVANDQWRKPGERRAA